jgi:hypothetical protein
MTKTHGLRAPVAATITILLTAFAPACSIEPLTNATDQTTEPTDQTNQTDQNEPSNGRPNVNTEPKLTYISCRDVRACTGLADCFDTFVSLCSLAPADGFYCGDERATLHVRGSLECGEAVVAAMGCCADIERAYAGAEGTK